MGFKLLQAPAAEPITLEEAKLHCRIYTSEDDSLVTSLITAAREQCEAYTRKAFITQKWRMYLDAFPGYIDQRLGGHIVQSPIAIGATSYMAGIRWAIIPPYPPVQSIDAVSFIGENGTQVDMTVNVDYVTDTVSEPARVCPPFGKFWPISRIQTNAVWIDWTAGYGNDGTSVPESIKAAMKLMVSYYYENREAAGAVQMKELPLGVMALLAPYTDLRMP